MAANRKTLLLSERFAVINHMDEDLDSDDEFKQIYLQHFPPPKRTNNAREITKLQQEFEEAKDRADVLLTDTEEHDLQASTHDNATPGQYSSDDMNTYSGSPMRPLVVSINISQPNTVSEPKSEGKVKSQVTESFLAGDKSYQIPCKLSSPENGEEQKENVVDFSEVCQEEEDFWKTSSNTSEIVVRKHCQWSDAKFDSDSEGLSGSQTQPLKNCQEQNSPNVAHELSRPWYLSNKANWAADRPVLNSGLCADLPRGTVNQSNWLCGSSVERNQYNYSDSSMPSSVMGQSFHPNPNYPSQPQTASFPVDFFHPDGFASGVWTISPVEQNVRQPNSVDQLQAALPNTDLSIMNHAGFQIIPVGPPPVPAVEPPFVVSRISNMDKTTFGSSDDEGMALLQEKEQLAKTLVQQCWALARTDMDKKAVGTVIGLIQQETYLGKEATANLMETGPGSRSSGNVGIDAEFSPSSSKSISNAASRSVDDSPDIDLFEMEDVDDSNIGKSRSERSKCSSPVPISSCHTSLKMKFYGRTLLKGGVAPRHIPKSQIQKPNCSPVRDPRGHIYTCSQNVMSLRLPLWAKSVLLEEKEKQAKLEKDKECSGVCATIGSVVDYETDSVHEDQDDGSKKTLTKSEIKADPISFVCKSDNNGKTEVTVEISGSHQSKSTSLPAWAVALLGSEKAREIQCNKQDEVCYKQDELKSNPDVSPSKIVEDIISSCRSKTCLSSSSSTVGASGPIACTMNRNDDYDSNIDGKGGMKVTDYAIDLDVCKAAVNRDEAGREQPAVDGAEALQETSSATTETQGSLTPDKSTDVHGMDGSELPTSMPQDVDYKSMSSLRYAAEICTDSSEVCKSVKRIGSACTDRKNTDTTSSSSSSSVSSQSSSSTLDFMWKSAFTADCQASEETLEEGELEDVDRKKKSDSLQSQNNHYQQDSRPGELCNYNCTLHNKLATSNVENSSSDKRRHRVRDSEREKRPAHRHESKKHQLSTRQRNSSADRSSSSSEQGTVSRSNSRKISSRSVGGEWKGRDGQWSGSAYDRLCDNNDVNAENKQRGEQYDVNPAQSRCTLFEDEHHIESNNDVSKGRTAYLDQYECYSDYNMKRHWKSSRNTSRLDNCDVIIIGSDGEGEQVSSKGSDMIHNRHLPKAYSTKFANPVTKTDPHNSIPKAYQTDCCNVDDFDIARGRERRISCSSSEKDHGSKRGEHFNRTDRSRERHSKDVSHSSAYCDKKRRIY